MGCITIKIKEEKVMNLGMNGGTGEFRKRGLSTETVEKKSCKKFSKKNNKMSL